MALVILLQPALLIAHAKADPDDLLFSSIDEFFRSERCDYLPGLSAVSYGLSVAAVHAAVHTGTLPYRQAQELLSRLQGLRGEFEEDRTFYSFDAESGESYAFVRQLCLEGSIQLSAEMQFEYAIALCKQLTLLAPGSSRAHYPEYRRVPVEFL